MSDAIDMGELLQSVKAGNQAGQSFKNLFTDTQPAVCHPHRITCVMCSKTKTVIALEPMPDRPILCHSCYRQVIPQYPALPTQVIGRYMAGPSFLDEYVDKRPEVV